MTLFDVAWLMLVFSFAVLGGVIAAERAHTGWAFFLGFPAGALVGWGAYYVLVALLIYPFLAFCEFWDWLAPTRPRCRNSACRTEDCKPVKADRKGCTLRCKCGNTYWHPTALPLRTEYFMEVRPDGSRLRYMKRRPFHLRWQRDESADPT